MLSTTAKLAYLNYIYKEFALSKIRLFVCMVAVPTGAQEVYKNPPQRSAPVSYSLHFHCLPVLRSVQFPQKSQNGLLPIHRRRWHTDVLLCTGMQRRRFFYFCRSASIPPHREHRHPPIVRSACPRSFCKLALRRWWFFLSAAI